jgi:hypothetical protein
LACTGAHGELVRALLAAGANASARTTHDARTPLHNAAEYGCADAVEALLAAGAAHRAATRSGVFPLGLAERRSDAAGAAAAAALRAAEHAARRSCSADEHDAGAAGVGSPRPGSAGRVSSSSASGGGRARTPIRGSRDAEAFSAELAAAAAAAGGGGVASPTRTPPRGAHERAPRRSSPPPAPHRSPLHYGAHGGQLEVGVLAC